MLAQGTRLGAYELVLPLASGGMGHVWVAVRTGDFGFRRTFALKVMREEFAEHPEFRRMFLEEAKIAARIRHSNVVEVIDLGEALSTVYQVMALVDGDSLARLIGAEKHRSSSGSAVSHDITVRVLSDVLRGLHAAHELRGEDGRPLGLVHRDVSPQNILVGLDGVTKVADFGIARAADPIFHDRSVKGKVAYMAPEQLAGGSIDRRSDVFAAGVVLWEMLTGRRALKFAELAVGGEAAPDPRSIEEGVSPHLARVVRKALAINVEDRFSTAEAMADALEDAARASGLEPSQRAVAPWVRGLAGERVSRLREDLTQIIETIERSRSAPAQSPDTPVEVAERSSRRLPGFRRRTWVLGSVFVVPIGVTALAYAVSRPSVTPSTAVSGAGAIESARQESLPESPPPHPAPPSSTPVTEAPSAPSQPPPAGAEPSATSGHIVRAGVARLPRADAGSPPRPVQKPAGTSTLRPQYNNPYAR